MNIGKYLALDKSVGSDVYMDALRPHVILICGKRGYGKSYTMGTLIEELSSLEPEVKKNIAVLVIDTMGIFWTMRQPNKKEGKLLSEWGLSSAGFKVEVFVPSGNVLQYNEMHIDVRPLSISTSELTGNDWCSLFKLSPLDPLGILLIRIIDDLKEKSEVFSIKKILETLGASGDVEKNILEAARNYFRAADSWGIFKEKGASILDLIGGGKVSILDLSSLDEQNIKAIVVKIFGKKIYDESIKSRRSYELIQMGDKTVGRSLPMVWMFMDEAHLFLPRDGETAATSVLVNEWLKQGRQPGLSVVFATQRPAALNSEVISQSDMIICHRLTAQDDIRALESISPTYIREGMGKLIKSMGEEKGIAIIVDDNTENAEIVRMRPRKSWHGGDEPSALGK
jgi:DNA helicase HerA-like ATPase